MAAVVGIECRGFIFAAPVALALEVKPYYLSSEDPHSLNFASERDSNSQKFTSHFATMPSFLFVKRHNNHSLSKILQKRTAQAIGAAEPAVYACTRTV
jgi:hypothetical protein